ncbi:hypothetical protein CTAYLR_000285 [Chrysophaeum taylorii]|uniref:Ankyrin repeat protein n=1 Tax=Chrysophaeum taylorii TaxID=2483200 RepID=A0AAD7UGD6_9STRA|nr:hypothetical protein CTAYLR_000285 [Chrysophaeum taylorii]
MDAYSRMELCRALGDETPMRDMGRAETAGTVKCPLCPARRQKRFARGRGFLGHMAHAHPNADVVSAVREADASVMTVEKAVLPKACAAARDGDSATLERLYDEGSWDPLGSGCRDRHGYRPHHWAAGGVCCLEDASPNCCLDACLERASARAVDELTRREQRDGKRGSRALLHWAARNGVARHARKLLVDTPPDVRTADGTTPLMLALYGGHLDVAELLVGRGAAIQCDLRNDWGCTDVHWAAMGNAPVRSLRWLARVYAGTEPFSHKLVSRQIHGHSAFHKLAQRGSADAVVFLARDALGASTTLLDAALAPDSSRRRPSQIARCAGFPDCADTLDKLQAGVAAAVQSRAATTQMYEIF